MKKKSLSILIAVAMTATTLLPAASVFADTTTATPVTSAPASSYGVNFNAHVQNLGFGYEDANNNWKATTQFNTVEDANVTDNYAAPNEKIGTTGLGLRVEGLELGLASVAGATLPTGASIQYQAQVQNVGWQAVSADEALAGTTGKGLRIEAVGIQIVNLPGYEVQYKAHVENQGWDADWTTEASTDTLGSANVAPSKFVGTVGKSLRVEALDVRIVKTTAENNAEIAAINDVATAQATPTADNVAKATTDIAAVKDITENASLTKLVQAINVPLAVSSVSAINAKQIQVVFDKAVDKATATDVTNYSVKIAGGTKTALTKSTSAATDATAALSADGKTATITLATPLTSTTNVTGGTALKNGDSLQFSVGTGVEDAQLANLAAESTSTIVYGDTTAPTLVSATATAKTSTNSVKVDFSEPIDTSLASATINGNAVTITPSTTNPDEVTLTSVAALTAGTTYNVSLLNFKDVAGNFTATNPLTTTVTVNADTTAPSIVSVTPTSNSNVEVKFSKSIDKSTVTNATLKLLDANLTGSYVGSVLPKDSGKTTEDDSVYEISVSGLTYNASGVFSGVVSYANTILDNDGNALTAGTTPITLTKDTTAPTVVSASYKNVANYNTIASTNGVVVVKFSKPVTAEAANAAYTVIDDLGNSTANSISAVQINPNDNTELVLSLANTITTTAKTYKVILPTGAVKDTSVEKNPSAAINETVDVTAGVPVAQDTTAPTIAIGDISADATGAAESTIKLAITETGSGIDLNTVTNTNNYRLNGIALPSGSYVTYATGVATIHIPTATIAKDGTYSLNVNGIADKAGNTITPFVDKTSVVLNDDVKPVLNSAVVNVNGTASLGFSEKVNAKAAATAADFAVKLNGSTLSAAGVTPGYTVTDGAGADAGKYVVTVGTRTVGIAATAGVVTGTNGKTYTGTASNVMKFNYIDVDGDGTFSAGDIVLSAVDTGAATAIVDAASANYDLNNASSLTISTIATPTTVTDTKADGTANVHPNALTGLTTIVVK